MLTIEEIVKSGVLTSLAKRSKLPYIRDADCGNSYDGIVYTMVNSEKDDDGILLCDLSRRSFDDSFSKDFIDSLLEDWLLYAAIPPSDDSASYVVVRPAYDESGSEMDPIRICDGEIYWHDIDWFGEEAFDSDELGQSAKEKERKEWYDTFNVNCAIVDNDYTSKPQSEWNEEDWRDFKSRSVPQAALKWNIEWDVITTRYDMLDFMVTTPTYGAPVEFVDVSKWRKYDWCYYWYVNSIASAPDKGWVWTYVQSSRIYLERERARDSGKWMTHHREYTEGGEEGYVYTPYGRLRIESIKIPSSTGVDGITHPYVWRGNVGVPYIYASENSYEKWLEMNLDAQTTILERFGRNETPVAATYGWTGIELEIPKPIFSSEDEDKPKRNPNFPPGTALADGMSEGKLHDTISVKRDTDIILGAPDWYNKMNNILNHFPARILFWAIALPAAAQAQLAGPDYGLVFLLVFLIFVNAAIPVLYPVLYLIRFVLDNALKLWAINNSMAIDWGERKVSKWEKPAAPPAS